LFRLAVNDTHHTIERSGHSLSMALVASYFTLAGAVLPGSSAPSPIGLDERAAAASSAGFAGIGLGHHDLVHLIALHGHAGIRAILADNGLDHVELEVARGWIRGSGAAAGAGDGLTALLAAAGELGAVHVKAGGDIGGASPTTAMIDGFGDLCAQARKLGTRIALEFSAVGNIGDAAAAMAIVDGANMANGGIFLDIWHVQRSGMSLDQVAALPLDRVFGIELSDADAAPRGSLLEDTVHHRKFCGEGDFPLTAFIAICQAKGYAGAYGVEILSDRVRRMPVAEVATMAFRTTAALLAGS
jgi:sugar phosphate isomerase/epimerase